MFACTATLALLGMFTDWQVSCCYMAVLSMKFKTHLSITYIQFEDLLYCWTRVAYNVLMFTVKGERSRGPGLADLGDPMNHES